ncbi:MAG: hypothetical protein WD851_03855 [Pirellulales bacterium]
MVTLWFQYGSVFAGLAAFSIAAAGCSDVQSQKEANSAEARSKVGTMLAVKELPERAEDDQPRQAESDGEKPDGEGVEIPLDQIRHATPWSRQLRDLEPEFFVYRDTAEKIARYSTPDGREELEEIRRKAEEQSLVLAIERAMRALPSGLNAKPTPGFAVKGTDRAALQSVYDVLVKGEEPIDSFPVGTAVSLVFFGHPTQPRVGLDRVELVDGMVKIHYMLVSHGSGSVTWYLAMIPCGKLPPGTYGVEMIRSSAWEKKYNQPDFPSIEVGAEDNIICRPFSFTVRRQESD